MFTNILGFEVFNKDMQTFMEYIEKYEKVNIVSGNPEILFNGFNDNKLKENFKSKNSIIIPDGVGTLIASKLVKNPIAERIPGIEVVKEVLKKANNEKKSIYLVGAKQEVVEECVKKIKKEFPDLIIAGYHNGFFDMNNCDDLVNDIIEKSPYAVFAAMGSPRQEIFINKIMPHVNTKIFMGVGGVFDIFAGKLKRAPKWMIDLGLEWLYRVVKEPVRIKRLASIPKFLALVLRNR
ncbi:MAG: WecB/TagA/CpsF family glycosyltransferase [Clostridium butyricum]|nr:WecB/TagA/CpsF family glycosyltransferase [Clostridium butyricum]